MPFLAVFSLLLSLLCLLFLSCVAQLSPSFYATSCPSAVSTISNTFLSLSKKDNVIPPSTLRLILHDCFVEGCDGSILLSSTSGNKAERDAADNANLPQNAFNAIIATKKAVEQVCPGVVSCADILAITARDSVVILGGPSWEVSLGRLDGRVSTAASVEGRLPGANFNIKQLTDSFAAVGLTLQDLVILSGAHTIGFTHCDQFKNRLYSFNSSVNVDPSMNPGFVPELQNRCPASGSDNLMPFDVITPLHFDNNYFKDLQAGKGILFSDQVLFQDASTRSTVDSMAASQDVFFKSFAQSMIKMTAIGVKQGAQGEVRKVCTAVNAGGANVQQPSPAGGTSQPTPPFFPPSQPPPNLVTPPAATVLPPPLPPKIVPTPVPSPANPAPLIFPPPPSPIPVALPPPTPTLPTPRLPSPVPVQFSRPPPPTLPTPRLPSPTPVQFAPPPPEEIFDEPVPPPPQGGFTIPGIPGLTPPIHIPFPGFGRGPPPGSGGSGSGSGSSSRSKSSAKNSRGTKSRKGV